jgi:hypothetical protein
MKYFGKRINATWTIALAAGVLGAGMKLIDRPVLAQSGEIVMVASKANAAATVSKGDAKKLLLGQTLTWPGGAPVIVVLTPAGSAQRTTVLTKLCGMTESDFTRYQMQVAFTGRTATTIHEEHSVAGVTAFVKAHPGAVGFLPKSEAGDDVKVVLAVE